jgi:hypothetical protein
MITKEKDIFSKKKDKKTYVKYSLAGLLVLFIVFVVYRQISIQNQSNAVDVLKEKPAKDPRLSENKTENRLDQIVSEDSQIKKPLVMEKRKVTQENSTEKSLAKPMAVAMENVIQAKKSEEMALSEDSLAIKPARKQTDIGQLFEKQPMKIKRKKSADINVNMGKIQTPFDLKSIQEQIVLQDNAFKIGNEVFTEGKNLGDFTVVKIQEHRIRFKKEENFFYDLRFFN